MIMVHANVTRGLFSSRRNKCGIGRNGSDGGNANVALHLVDQPRELATYVAGWGDPTKNFEPGDSSWPLDDRLPLTDAIREAKVINIPDVAADDPYKGSHPDRSKFRR